MHNLEGKLKEKENGPSFFWGQVRALSLDMVLTILKYHKQVNLCRNEPVPLILVHHVPGEVPYKISKLEYST